MTYHKKSFSKKIKYFVANLIGWGLLLNGYFSLPSYAENSRASELYHQAARVDVKLGLLSNKKADIILRIPTEQAYGFAGEATTPEQKAAVDTVVDNIKQNIGTIIAVEPALECKHKINDIDKFDSTKEDYEEIVDGNKKKIRTEYKILKVDLTLNCLKELPDKKISINLNQNFKNINKILVNLKAKQQRRFVIENSSGSFSF